MGKKEGDLLIGGAYQIIDDDEIELSRFDEQISGESAEEFPVSDFSDELRNPSAVLDLIAGFPPGLYGEVQYEGTIDSQTAGAYINPTRGRVLPTEPCP